MQCAVSSAACLQPVRPAEKLISTLLCCEIVSGLCNFYLPTFALHNPLHLSVLIDSIDKPSVRSMGILKIKGRGRQINGAVRVQGFSIASDQ